MKMKAMAVMLAMACVLVVTSAATATGFYAVTNELGYKGQVWNITKGTGSWDLVPVGETRNANLYAVSGIGSQNYNIVLSSWWEHKPSNQNPGFLQLYDESNLTVTSMSGAWNESRTSFTVSVTGENAPYPWSRFWQPDAGHAWGVTFTDYQYSFTATYSTPATEGDGGFYSTDDPDSIVGTFIGEFVSTYDLQKNPITDGDNYGFAVQFDSSWFDPDGGDYGQITPQSEFGTVPEPVTVLGVLGGLAGLGAYWKKRRAAAQAA